MFKCVVTLHELAVCFSCVVQEELHRNKDFKNKNVLI